jgi:hypothetical protein
MTERTHSMVLGRFAAGFIGVVAMAALVTGAVAAANTPSQAVVVADATATPTPTPTPTATATATATETAEPTATLHATENPSFEASEHPSGGPESTSTATAKPGASCNPSLDNKEDAAERQANGAGGDQSRTGGDQTPNPAAAPTASPTPEPSEPPSCLKVNPDSHGDQKSGKTDAPPVGGSGGDGPGHSGGLTGATPTGLPDSGRDH